MAKELRNKRISVRCTEDSFNKMRELSIYFKNTDADVIELALISFYQDCLKNKKQY